MDENKDPREFPVKPLSAREFLEFFPLDMSDEEKDELAAEMEQSAADNMADTDK